MMTSNAWLFIQYSIGNLEEIFPFLYPFWTRTLAKKKCLDMGPASFKNVEMEIDPLESSDDKMSTFLSTHIHLSEICVYCDVTAEKYANRSFRVFLVTPRLILISVSL